MILQILMYSLGQSANYSVSAPNPSWVCSVILGLEFCRPHLSLPEAVVLCQCGAPEGSWNTGGEKRPCSSLFCCCTCQLQPSNCSSPQLWKLVPASFFFFLLHFQNSLMGCSQRKLQQLGSVLRGLGPGSVSLSQELPDSLPIALSVSGVTHLLPANATTQLPQSPLYSFSALYHLYTQFPALNSVNSQTVILFLTES